MNSFLINAGFARSWKLISRLTTRSEDNHATPDPGVIHPFALLQAWKRVAIVEKND